MATFSHSSALRSFERNGDRISKSLPLPYLSSSRSVWEDGKLRNHSRECGPYISKLLNEAYNGICLYVVFPTERTRAYLVLCRIRPDVYSTRENQEIRTIERERIVVTRRYSPRRSSTSNSSARLRCTVSEIVSYLMWHHLPRAWIRSQTSWLRRKRCTEDVNLHLHLAPWRMVTALY